MKSERLRSLAVIVACCWAGAAAAQQAEPPAARTITIEADHVEGEGDEQVRATGNARVEDEQGNRFFADDIIYFPRSQELNAEGKVRAERGEDVIEGARLRYEFTTDEGTLEDASYYISRRQGRGSAAHIELLGPNEARLTEASYTTCPVGQDDWFLRAADLELDRETNIGVARGARLVFKDTTLLYTPWIDFPLTAQRKSGVLTPSIGSSERSGFEVSLPYYWNIAPNRDATITPRYLAKRGLQLNAEVRYLEENYRGILIGEYLPDDNEAQEDRYGWKIDHTHQFGGGFSGFLRAQRVSDDFYFTDLSNRVAFTSLTNLPREAGLAYSTSWATLNGRVQRFQTLQDPINPVDPPYGRAPQLVLNARRDNVRGLDLALHSEAVDFEHLSKVTGSRFSAYPSIAYPLRSAFAYVKPKAGLHYTRYDLDRDTTALPDSTRTVPIVSLDSGLVFERPLSLQGTDFTQTLEPRLFYLYVPYRNQSPIPNFDTAVPDFNFTQLFAENRFTGGDRIGDANQVTVALTSRLVDNTGSETLRAAIGQIYHFDSPDVALETAPAPSITTSNLLAAITGRVAREWLMDAGLEYNPDLGEYRRLSLGARYTPGFGKVVNLGYRFIRDSVEAVDASTQWPITANVYGLARLNYSTRDSRLVDGIAGLEYDGGCWVMRGVVQRFANKVNESTTSFFLQLELNGLSRIGASPLDILKQNIGGYTKINERDEITGEASYR